jgi:glycosyltransferase involved in cell wall biosynthesis
VSTTVPDRIAVTIVTYNRASLLAELLESVLAMAPAPWCVVVVDNASTDATAQVLDEAALAFASRGDRPRLVVHRLDVNSGGAGGFSAGTRVALEEGADWVWLMDDDVEVIPDALARLAPWMARFSCLHGRRYDVDGSPFFWQAKFNDFLAVPLPYTRRAFGADGYALTNSGTFEGMMVAASVVRQIGLPDPRFFISWDDAVYAWLASHVTDVAYVDAFVLRRKRPQRQVNLGLRHLNDSSPLARYHVMRNRAYVAKYFQTRGALHPVGFALGSGLTFAKEVFRLVAVERTLRGIGDLIRGVRDSRRLWSDPTWRPMDPADVPPSRSAAQH